MATNRGNYEGCKWCVFSVIKTERCEHCQLESLHSKHLEYATTLGEKNDARQSDD